MGYEGRLLQTDVLFSDTAPLAPPPSQPRHGEYAQHDRRKRSGLGRGDGDIVQSQTDLFDRGRLSWVIVDRHLIDRPIVEVDMAVRTEVVIAVTE